MKGPVKKNNFEKNRPSHALVYIYNNPFIQTSSHEQKSVVENTSNYYAKTIKICFWEKQWYICHDFNKMNNTFFYYNGFYYFYMQAVRTL